MKYIIDGKSAFLVAQKHGVSAGLFYWRINHKYWSMKDAATIPPRKKSTHGHKYVVKKDGQYVRSCRTTADVAKVIGSTKGAVCGMLYRHGKKIKMLGYTIKQLDF